MSSYRRCLACDESVTLTEKGTVDGHDTCFKCRVCGFLMTGGKDGELYFAHVCTKPPEFHKSSSSSSSSSGPKCFFCDEPIVDQVDTVVVETRVYHKMCFKCRYEGCNDMTPENYSLTCGYFYCNAHSTQALRDGKVDFSFPWGPKHKKP